MINRFSKITLRRGDIKSTNLACLFSVWPGDTSDSRNSSLYCIIQCMLHIGFVAAKTNLFKYTDGSPT